MPERYGINVDLLVDLGLTQNQAKVYLSAAKIGPASISDLADHSGVRREEIYRLLPDLEKAGLVERLMGKPMRIRAPDVKSAMSTLIRHERARARERISEFVEKTVQIEDYLSKTGLQVETGPKESDDFALLEEKDSVRTRLHELIQDAKNSISLVYSRPNLIWFLSTQSQLLKESVSRGVKIRILSSPTDGKDRIPKIIERRFSNPADVDLKYITGKFVNYVIIDSTAALLVTSKAQQPNAHNLYTRNPSLVTLMHQGFEEAWHRSSHWKTVEGVSISERPLDTGEAGISNNVMLLYHDVKSKTRIVSNFIKEKLEGDCFVLYICPDDELDTLHAEFESNDIDVASYEKNDLLKIEESKNFFGDKDSFSIDRIIDYWDKIYFQANDRDLTTVLIIDTQFFFDNDMTDRIVEFESECRKELDSHMSALCIYSKDAILSTKDPLGLYNEIVMEHDKVLNTD